MPKVNLRQHVAHTTDQLSSSGQTKAMPKNLSLNEEKSGGWASRQKKDKTERAIGVGRRTWEEIVKWTWMRALRFQTRVCVGEGWGGRETSDIPSLSSGIMFEREWDKTKLNKLWRQRADQRNFLDLGKVWKAVFWPPPGCKGRTLDSLDSWHRDQVPTSMATYHRHVEGWQGMCTATFEPLTSISQCRCKQRSAFNFRSYLHYRQQSLQTLGRNGSLQSNNSDMTQNQQSWCENVNWPTWNLLSTFPRKLHCWWLRLDLLHWLPTWKGCWERQQLTIYCSFKGCEWEPSSVKPTMKLFQKQHQRNC